MLFWVEKETENNLKMERRIIFTALFFCKTSRHCKGLSLEASAVYFNAIIISSGQCFKAESCLHNHFLQFFMLKIVAKRNKHGAYIRGNAKLRFTSHPNGLFWSRLLDLEELLCQESPSE